MEEWTANQDYETEELPGSGTRYWRTICSHDIWIRGYPSKSGGWFEWTTNHKGSKVAHGSTKSLTMAKRAAETIVEIDAIERALFIDAAAPSESEGSEQ